MSAQNSLQNEMLQQGEITFKGIVQNTAGLSSLLTAEQEASQDYKKVRYLRKSCLYRHSNAFKYGVRNEIYSYDKSYER